jgi:DNA-binding response OmpR family regulator
MDDTATGNTAAGAARSQGEVPLRVLLYSHDASTRGQVRSAVGRRPAEDVPEVEFVECATEAGVFRRLHEGGIDLAILDGEAQPAGGMGVCRQAKDEIYRCPPMMVLIARPQDRWLADWSRAVAVATRPVDPLTLPTELAEMIRARRGGTVASRPVSQ